MPQGDSNPWPLRYRSSTLPTTEVSSHTGASNHLSVRFISFSAVYLYDFSHIYLQCYVLNLKISTNGQDGQENKLFSEKISSWNLPHNSLLSVGEVVRFRMRYSGGRQWSREFFAHKLHSLQSGLRSETWQLLCIFRIDKNTKIMTRGNTLWNLQARKLIPLLKNLHVVKQPQKITVTQVDNGFRKSWKFHFYGLYCIPIFFQSELPSSLSSYRV